MSQYQYALTGLIAGTGIGWGIYGEWHGYSAASACVVAGLLIGSASALIMSLIIERKP